MDPKDELKPPVVLQAQKTSNSSLFSYQTCPALRPPSIFCPGEEFILWIFRALYLTFLHHDNYCQPLPQSQGHNHPMGDLGRSSHNHTTNSAPVREVQGAEVTTRRTPGPVLGGSQGPRNKNLLGRRKNKY
ncbi:hypothetical protein X801_09525 [Opisthorchis viverrini]|uniref:Uncharacterized protein n=1 Tax=Opisthorchis viverrini TaxID=6198 RepID=A0A1S8WJR1_OPIVI|nr:hypothetical protein X801_09525 [Opisthorchis viverrini]